MQKKKAWVLWLINLFLFGGFVWNISQQSVWIAKLDNQSSNFFNSLIEPSLTYFFIIIARLFTPLLVLIYTAAITEFLKKFTLRCYWFDLLSGYLIMELLKVIIKRPRPANSLVHATGFSFPSAHVFEITLVIVTSHTILKSLRISERKKVIVQIILFLIWFLVALSRLYLQVHYFSDVIGGVWLAIIWGTLINLIFRK